jgi:hypothetical protein
VLLTFIVTENGVVYQKAEEQQEEAAVEEKAK